jgi:hypothetical protein
MGGAEGPPAPLEEAPLGEAKLGDASRTGYRPPQGCTPYREWLCWGRRSWATQVAPAIAPRRAPFFLNEMGGERSGGDEGWWD